MSEETLPEWKTEPPDFTVYGFHTGKKIEFRLKDGREIAGIYQGWDVYTSDGVDYIDVVAWREAIRPLPGE